MAFLDNIKDRLGFGNAEEEEFDEELYGQDFDDFDEDYENQDFADDNAGDADGGYSAFSPITIRGSGSSRRSDPYPSDRRGATHPPLVSIEDVRNSTRVPESLNRDPLPPRRTNSLGRAAAGRSSDYALSGSEVQASPATEQASASRSEGFNSLFENGAQSAAQDFSQAQASGYDPYRALEDTSAPGHRPTRNVSVLSPISYNEVENVARMLRAGDAVVLSLRNTPNQLSKRILDFSFGVASALDATVDCVADKVFAITRGSDLSEDELSRLRAQGVI